MPYSAPLSYEHEEQESATMKWVILFVVMSVLAHVLLLAVLIILSKHMPDIKLSSPPPPPTTTINLIEPPPQAKKLFMTTPDQHNTKPKIAQVESDHNTDLASRTKEARKQDTIMPNVESKTQHATALDSAPATPPAKSQDQTTPPSPKADPAKPTPPQPPAPPQPTKTEPQKTPPQDATKPPPPKAQPAPPKPTPPQPAYDDNGLPVLPAITAQTMAPQYTPNNPPPKTAAPPPTMPAIPQNVAGRAGMSGAPTPDAMKTDLGAYKARFYAAVGSRWYPKIGQNMQLIGVGSVRVQYTIMPDGVITTKVLDPGGGSMLLLLTSSVSSIRECSPFLPFPPSMLKDYPNGYTDDFSFSIY